MVRNAITSNRRARSSHHGHSATNDVGQEGSPKTSNYDHWEDWMQLDAVTDTASATRIGPDPVDNNDDIVTSNVSGCSSQRSLAATHNQTIDRAEGRDADASQMPETRDVVDPRMLDAHETLALNDGHQPFPSEQALELQAGLEAPIYTCHDMEQHESARASLDTICSAFSTGTEELNDELFMTDALRQPSYTRDSVELDPLSRPKTTLGRKAPKKTAHNVVEKRYRVNLNGKIAALRDSVPSLRRHRRSTLTPGKAPEAVLDQKDDLEEEQEGQASATQKLNKATVLSKATEYIGHLEQQNQRLEAENAALKRRISDIERLAMTGSWNHDANAASNGSASGDHVAEEASASPGGSKEVPQGMIRVPENFRRFYAAQSSQQHYAVPTRAQQRAGVKHGNAGEEGGGGAGSLMNKLMVGSLAGLV
ncbi:MAG: hypothetical protein M1833_001513 [Piccolia ochrophora]|nr:MAG: hypothetical protein M1833_001513 [Piccolia ochrophora]